MKKLFLTIFLTTVSAVLFAQTKEEKLQNLMERYSELNKFNGSVLVTQNGKTLLNQGYGFSNIDENLRNDASTIFRLGSLTKQFTAVVILKLQEMKKLDVQDKVSKYFPDFPMGDSITIENLLTHTSGIFNYTDDLVFMQTQAMKPISEEKMIGLFKNKPLNFSPSTDWAYSNSNYMLLGYIIQKVTKKPYEQVVKEFIFQPLNMDSTGFDFTGLKRENKAKGYKDFPEKGSKESADFDPTVSYAAGAIYSTTGDLYKWQKGLSSGKILKKASVDKAFTPFKNKYGYGVYIDSIYGKRLIAHGGLTFGFTSYMGKITEDDVSVVLLNNIVNYSINLIAKDVLAILYDQPYKIPEAKKEITMNAEVLKKYAGIYELSPQFSIIFTVEDGNLFGEPTGQPKVQLYAEKGDLFFLKGVDIRIEFKKDKDGNIIELILIEGKMSTLGRKVK